MKLTVEIDGNTHVIEEEWFPDSLYGLQQLMKKEGYIDSTDSLEILDAEQRKILDRAY